MKDGQNSSDKILHDLHIAVCMANYPLRQVSKNAVSQMSRWAECRDRIPQIV